MAISKCSIFANFQISKYQFFANSSFFLKKFNFLLKRGSKMFKRKIYDELLKWKRESNGRSALLIEGAKRIGKTTITVYFAQNDYPSY